MTSRESEERDVGPRRPVEPFQRPYSGPEPPSAARRPRRRALLVAGVALAVVAVAGFLVAPGRGGGTDRASVMPRRSAPPRTPPAEPAERARLVTALPPPCGTVTGGTAERAVPRATRRQSANSTLTTCTYSSAGSEFRWLRVETRLYAPAGTETPVRDAESYYDAQWAQAHAAPLVQTITLERQGGVGDEAFRWFKADEGQPTVVGQVTVRVRNAVFTVSYSERAPAGGERAERERGCLAEATAVAREVLAALNHF